MEMPLGVFRVSSFVEAKPGKGAAFSRADFWSQALMSRLKLVPSPLTPLVPARSAPTQQFALAIRRGFARALARPASSLRR